MHQVLAEQALADALVEILMRRRDDPHAGLLRRVTADAVILAVGEHAQEPHLEVGRHVADFVEEQRAALGLLEPAATR
jgi:sulfide:quinone oxidoreductase